jgi:hypothetical protein
MRIARTLWYLGRKESEKRPRILKALMQLYLPNRNIHIDFYREAKFYKIEFVGLQGLFVTSLNELIYSTGQRPCLFSTKIVPGMCKTYNIFVASVSEYVWTIIYFSLVFQEEVPFSCKIMRIK